MKKLVVLLAIALVSETMIAQAGPATPATASVPVPTPAPSVNTGAVTPPQVVIDSFNARFPNTPVKKWLARPKGFIADFKLNGQQRFADYGPDGTWVGTETPIKFPFRFPHDVKQGWRHSDFSAWYLVKAYRIVTPGQTLYALDVNNSPLLDAEHMYNFNEEFFIYFSENGKLVRKDRQ
jgi:hypothetical protein